MHNEQSIYAQYAEELRQRSVRNGNTGHGYRRAEHEFPNATQMCKLLTICNRLLLQATEEKPVLQEICHAIAETGGYPWVWIGLTNPDTTGGVHLVAQTGQARGHLELLSAAWPGFAWDETPIAIALRSGQPCVINDVLRDASDTLWRSEALKSAYGAVLALPIVFGDEQNSGVLNIYANAAGVFSAEQVRLFMELATDLAAGLPMLRARRRQQQAEVQVQQLQTELEQRTQRLTDQLVANNRVLEAEIIKRTQAEQLFQQAVQQHETLHRISSALVAATDLEDLLQAFATPFLAHGSCNVDLFCTANDEEGQPIWAELIARIQTAHGPAVPLGMRYHMQDLPLGHRLLAAPQQIALISNVDFTHAWMDERTLRTMKSINARAMVGIPLIIANQRWIGVITLSWPHPHSLNAQEQELCRMLAPLLATQVENRRLRALAQQSAEHDRLVAEHATYMISRQTPEGIYLYVSPASEMLLGYKPEDLLDHLAYTFYHPEDQEAVRKSHATIIELPVSHTVTYRIRRKDGIYIWVETTGRAIRDPMTGTVQEILTVSRDVTDRRQVEEARAELSRQNASLVQAMSEVVYDHLVKQDTILWSGEYTRVLGYSPEEMGADEDSWLERVHLGDLPQVLEEFDNAFAEGRMYDLEYRFRHREGHYVWLNTRGVLHIDSEGKLDRIIGVMRDVTARKQAEEQLKQRTRQLEAANKELEAFSYSVSHDLRAPLNSIDGFSRALLEDYGEHLDAEGQDYLQRVRAAGKRMACLIDDLLGLARVTRSEMRREAVHLSDLVHAVVADLRKIEPERQVTVTIAPDIIAEGDSHLLQVVVENLLGNAWKFTSKQPQAHIEFGILEQDDTPVYFVSDNGAGFDMTYSEKLFGAFQRLHTSSEFTGTGIGLATVQRIIHRHGGQVWADGAVGQGATFYFTLAV
jgi:PAS domain S-box-containing protein